VYSVIVKKINLFSAKKLNISIIQRTMSNKRTREPSIIEELPPPSKKQKLGQNDEETMESNELVCKAPDVFCIQEMADHIFKSYDTFYDRLGVAKMFQLVSKQFNAVVKRNPHYETHFSITHHLPILGHYAESGYLSCLRFYLEMTKIKKANGLYITAAKHGRLEIMKYINTTTLDLNRGKALNYAAAAGSVECMRYILEVDMEVAKVSAMRSAAEHGHLDCIKFLKELGIEIDTTSCMLTAKRKGNYECLEYLLNNLTQHSLCPGKPPNREQSIRCGTECSFDTGLSEAVASKGDIKSLQLIQRLGGTIGRFAIARSIDTPKEKRMEIVKYLIANDAPLDTFATLRAAESGDLECLIYLHENGVPLHEKCCEAAASNGHLECLKYAHKNGAPTDNVLRNAALGGHLECIKYGQECGEILKPGHRDDAACHLECLKYIDQRVTGPWRHKTSECVTYAGNYDCLVYITERGCPLTHKCLETAIDYHGEDYDRSQPNMIDYLLSKNCPVGVPAMKYFVKNRDVERIKKHLSQNTHIDPNWMRVIHEKCAKLVRKREKYTVLRQILNMIQEAYDRG